MDDEGATEQDPQPAERPRTETRRLRASRVNAKSLAESMERLASQHGLRSWTKVEETGWLGREVVLTVHGPPSAIEALIADIGSIEAVRMGGGDAAMPG